VRALLALEPREESTQHAATQSCWLSVPSLAVLKLARTRRASGLPRASPCDAASFTADSRASPSPPTPNDAAAAAKAWGCVGFQDFQGLRV